MIRKKLFAPFLMLLSGAITAIVMFIKDYGTTPLLVTVLCVMIFFYLVGAVIQKMIISYVDLLIEEEQKQEAESEEEAIEEEDSVSDKDGAEV